MLNGASLPPVTATSAMPERTIQNAWPMAWFEDEQAVEIVKVGPVIAVFHRDVAGAGVRHRLRNRQRMHARLVAQVDVLEALLLGVLAAHARTGDDGRAVAQLRSPLDARVPHRLARRDHRELGEAIQKVGLLVLEIVGGAYTRAPPRRWGTAAR